MGPFAFTGQETLSLEADLERQTRVDRSAEALRGLALLRLFQGRFDEATDLLLAARSESPDDSAIANDLAAAYLARAHDKGSLFDYLLGAEAAAQALTLSSNLPEARFNLALALQGIHLDRRAQKAWEEYLELDPSSEWAHEARRQLVRLERPTDHDRWVQLLAALETDVAPLADEQTLRSIASVAQQARREVVERLLPRWAEAASRGSTREAERTLELAVLISRALPRSGRELVRDAVEPLVQPAESPPLGASHALLTGLQDFGTAIDFVRQRDYDSAQAPLRRAERSLRAAGSPLAEWAAYHRAVALYSRSPSDAAEELSRLHGRILRSGYLDLLGRVEWMIGLSVGATGNYSAALERYESAVERFSTINDHHSIAGIQPAISEAYRKLGQHRPAWDHRLLGVAAVVPIGEPQRVISALEEMLRALLEEDRLELSALVQEELLARATEWEDSPTGLTSALLKRASLLHRLGADREALLALAEAERALDRVQGDGDRQRLRADLEETRAVALVDRAPGEACRLLSRCIERTETTGHESRAPILLQARARCRLELGDDAAAGADLERAIELSEQHRRETSVESWKITFFETSQPLYDEMVRFQLDHRGDVERALFYADRSRSRALSDTVLAQATREHDRSATSVLPALPENIPGWLDRLQASIPEGVAVIEYGVLSDRLLVWSLRRNTLELAELPLPATALSAQVAAFRSALRRRDEPTLLRERAAVLFDSLIQPVARSLAGAGHVAIVPDRFLHYLPFAALWDDRLDQYLIEKHGVVVAPSAEFLLDRAAGSPSLRPRHPSVLVIADPAFDRKLFPDLGPLPGAEAEGREVAAAYPISELLSGSRATPEALLGSMGRYSVLHLATHVVVDERDPARTTIALAAHTGDPSGGMLSARALHTAPTEEIELAFLSACSTASVFPSTEREGLAGLARELLSLGIPAVVAALWEVDDETGRELASSFHRAYAAGRGPSLALREAQVALLSTHPHPSGWSAFQAYGAVPELSK